MKRFHFSILFQQLPDCFGILVIFQPEAFFMKSEIFPELLEYMRHCYMQRSDGHYFNTFESIQTTSSFRQSFLCRVICYDRYNTGEHWYILRLGGAKLKFALPTAQSIPKACLIKCFSLLQKTKVHLWNCCCVYSVLSNTIQVKGSLSKLSYLHEAGEPSGGLPDWHLLGCVCTALLK